MVPAAGLFWLIIPKPGLRRDRFLVWKVCPRQAVVASSREVVRALGWAQQV